MNEVVENVNEVEVLEPAGFWRRLGARILDILITSIGIGAIFGIIWMVIAFFIFDAGEVFNQSNQGSGNVQKMNDFSLIWNFLSFITAILYIIFLIASKWQATLGKRVVDVYVTTNDNKRLTPLRSTMRELTFSTPGIISFLCMIAFIIATQAVNSEMFEATMNMQGLNEAEMNAIIQEHSERMAQVFKENGGYLLTAFVIFFFGKLAMVAPIIFRKDKKGLHDIICGTRVYKGRKG